MIRVNMLSDQDRVRIQTLVDFYNRPANLRDPESKKVRCKLCRRKMPMGEFRLHTHNWVVLHDGDAHQHTGRKNPHFSKFRLQLVERTRKLLPAILPDDIDADDLQYLVREARTKANRELKVERKATAKIRRDQQKLSRKINA